MNNRVIVVGGGAAGMMCAVIAAKNGAEVALYEKNEKLGKKLFITGKGRCNLTNACDLETLFENIVTNPKFMYSSIYSFTNHDVMNFFDESGLRLKTERGERVFPASDKSYDVIRTLEKELKAARVEVHLNTEVEKIISEDGSFSHIELAGGKKVFGSACVIATGGISYATTGSTGDGYIFAREAGHTVTDLKPGLVPMEVKEDWIGQLQGLSLKNVEVSISSGKKCLYREFGEMLFTHYGVSGPLILSASSIVGGQLKNGPLQLTIDLKPALTPQVLNDRLLREFDANKNKQFKNILGSLLLAKLIPVAVSFGGIDGSKKVNEITKEERLNFVNYLKHFTLTLTGLRGFKEAIITRGGIKVNEVDPHTMESKKEQNLYFIGEVLDVDALTGGFNLQIAWSTAYQAGIAVSERIQTKENQSGI